MYKHPIIKEGIKVVKVYNLFILSPYYSLESLVIQSVVAKDQHYTIHSKVFKVLPQVSSQFP